MTEKYYLDGGIKTCTAGNALIMETPHIDLSAEYAGVSSEKAAPTTPSERAAAAQNVALSNPLVLAARAFEKDGKTVLAVLTEPIYLASERAELKRLLEKEASAVCRSPVTLTFDLDVYRRISPDMGEDVKTLILKKLKIM